MVFPFISKGDPGLIDLSRQVRCSLFGLQLFPAQGRYLLFKGLVLFLCGFMHPSLGSKIGMQGFGFRHEPFKVLLQLLLLGQCFPELVFRFLPAEGLLFKTGFYPFQLIGKGSELLLFLRPLS